jgi:hypothetical protein
VLNLKTEQVQEEISEYDIFKKASGCKGQMLFFILILKHV